MKFDGVVGRTGRVKKLCWHTTFGDICVDEPQYLSSTEVGVGAYGRLRKALG